MNKKEMTLNIKKEETGKITLMYGRNKIAVIKVNFNNAQLVMKHDGGMHHESIDGLKLTLL